MVITLGVSESDLARTATAHSLAKAEHARISRQQYTSTSGSDIRAAEQRRDDTKRKFEAMYNQYVDEMRDAGQTPRPASWWLR